MAENRVLIIGSKETFLVRALIKKLADAGIDNKFTPWTVDDINAAWEETTALVTLYMEEGESPGEEIIHFIMDKMNEIGAQMIIIGARLDIQFVIDRIPGDLIFKTLERPIDNAAFVQAVSEFIRKMDAGELRKSILIVDDDPTYLALVRDWLKEKYRVSMVNSGLQAIKFLGKNKVDLILLDHEMPVTSGPQVLEMLRSDEETKNIPVIFLTGKSDKESVMAVVALKPEGYFLKSVTRVELLEKLDEFFILHR
ncbi:MAG: response regulator [Lachnospiraceae bacterium]|nr:response regulator [Lachnospiraceae bacterium]